MFKKISMIAIIFVTFYLMLSPNVLSNVISEKENSKGLSLRTIFAANPLIIIESEPFEEHAIPNSGVIIGELKVYFKLTGIIGHYVETSSSLRGTTIGIHLEVEETEPWINANLKDDLVQMRIGDDTPYSTSVQITVTEQAPAFKQGKVKVKATSPEISGLFFTRVKEGEVMVDIPFIVGYWPVLSSEIEKSFMEISPLKVTNIPIKLGNIGNGPTYVMIEIVDKPEKWNFTYPTSLVLGSPALGQENEKEVEIQVRPPKYFSRENINILITHHYHGRPDLQGKPTNLHIVLQNDGSLKEKEEGLDITLLIIIVVAIVIIIHILIFLKRKHFNKQS